MKKLMRTTLAALALTAAAAQAQTLSFLTFTPGNEHIEALEDLIADFEATHDGITIDYTFVPYGDYFVRLQTDFAAGNPPDVFELNFENFATFASRGTLLNLDQYLDQAKRDFFYGAALDAFAWEGAQYALPISFSTVVMFYNADMFDAAGLKHPNDNWTWADVEAAAVVLTDADNRIWGYSQPLQFFEFYKTAAQAGGGLVVEPGNIQIDTPENRRALQRLVDNTRTLGITPTLEQMSGMGDTDLFVAGQLGMIVTGIWMFDHFIQNAPFNWDIVVEPGDARQATHFFSNAAAVSSTTDHPEAAFAWVEYLAANQKTVETRIARSWELPALSLEQAEALAPYLSQPVPDNREAVFASLEFAVTPPVVENQPELQDIIDTELEAALLGLKSVEQALADAQRRVEELMR